MAEVAGHGVARITSAEMPAVRRKPGAVPEGWSRVTPSLLRYSDEQSIAGVAAVFNAIEAMGGGPEPFEPWGVVVAPRFLGRANLSVVLRRFAAESVWGTSPHLIPHFALHSPSGTISLALGSHGPNVGVGGGLHSPAEGFLMAMSWLQTGVVPGVWLVLTGWTPELRPDGASKPEGECQALAIALIRSSGPIQPQIQISVNDAGEVDDNPISLLLLQEDLDGRSVSTQPRTIATDPTGGVQIRWIPGSTG